MKELITIYRDVLSENTCNHFIKKFDEAGQLFKIKAGVAVDNSKSIYDPNSKIATDLSISETPNWEEEDKFIFNNLKAVVKQYLIDHKDYSPYISYTSDEGYRIRRYPKGTGFFKCHNDTGPATMMNRRLAIIWYLNNVEEGGETEFPTLDFKVKPIQGSVLIFPPYWMYPHGSAVTVSNDKYIIRTFMRKDIPNK